MRHQSLEALVRGKELELEQAAEAYRNLQWLKQQTEDKERNALREKDVIIGQLQSALQSRSQETQVPTFTPSRVAFVSNRFHPSAAPLFVDQPAQLVHSYHRNADAALSRW